MADRLPLSPDGDMAVGECQDLFPHKRLYVIVELLTVCIFLILLMLEVECDVRPQTKEPLR